MLTFGMREYLNPLLKESLFILIFIIRLKMIITIKGRIQSKNGIYRFFMETFQRGLILQMII